MAKFISVEEAVAKIPDGAVIMVGGFLGCGTPHSLIDALAKSGQRDLTLIGNDSGCPGGPLGESHYGVAKLVHNHQVKKLIVGHIGSNREAIEQMHSGELEVSFVPQGSLSEMIRAAGAGLGGVLTQVGLGTIVEDYNHTAGTIELDGKTYLIEKPLHADFALLSGYRVDKRGNIWYKGNARNYNPIMATAADTVIVEADHVVEIGDIEPENVMTSYVFVDYIVDGGTER